MLRQEIKALLDTTSTAAKQDEIIQALIYGVEASRFQGTATGGSTTTLIDTAAVWEADLFKGDTISIEIGDKRYLAEITGNTADTISFEPLAEEVVAEMRYWIYKRVKSVILAPETTKKIGVVEIQGKETVGFENISVEDTVATLTQETVGDNTSAVITVEDDPIRIRVDGVAPTVDEGHLVYPNEVITLESAAELNSFKAIRATANNAKIKVSYKVVS